MIHIQVICPDPNDATSFYRGVGPMSRLRKQYPDEIHVRWIPEMNWSTILEADIVFMQRPFHRNHMACAAMIKGANIPLWIDYDDNLFAILQDNPVYHIYSAPEVQDSVKKISALADVVTCTTESLATALRPYSDKVRVVPNAFDDITCKVVSPRPVPEFNSILWRGTNTHERDLKTVEKEIIELSYDSSFADWKFVFVGYNPWWLTEKMKPSQYMVSGGAQLIDYMRAIHDLQPRIMIVPLEKNPFNAAKSNIAWIEGTFAGAATIARDMDEWKRPGVLNYDEPRDFVKCLRHLVESHNNAPEEDVLYQRNQESWGFIQKNLTLTEMTKVRRQIVTDLLQR